MKLIKEVVAEGSHVASLCGLFQGQLPQRSQTPQTVATFVISLTLVCFKLSIDWTMFNVFTTDCTNYGHGHYVNKITDDLHNFC